MRRKDREIVSYVKMIKIMQQCDCCRISLMDGAAPYIVPLNFGYDEKDGELYLYFHSATEGKKLELIRKHPDVGFEMDTKHALVTGETACAYSFLYQSIIGKGKMELLEENAEKIEGLNAIMRNYTNRDSWEYDSKVLDKIVVMRLCVTEWTCKEH